MFNRIVLNAPHSSPVFPFGKECWDSGIDAEIERWTDWYTDWLFQSADPRVVSVVYPISGFFCDVERLENDPVEAVVQGLVYKQFNGLNRSIPPADEEWARRSYYEHIDRLKAAIRDEHTLLIDCHSFPADLSDVDFCIGFNEDWSRPNDSVIDLVASTFRYAEYMVGVNTPYSNSISPANGFEYQSIMIEVNKKEYLGKNIILSIERVSRLWSSIDGLYKAIWFLPRII